MDKKKTTFFYRFIKRMVWLFYPKTAVAGTENLPDGPCIVVGNHTQMNSPIATELYFPAPFYIWCAGEMMHWNEVQPYAFRDFWSQKPKAVRWFYKLLSYLIVPLSVAVFTNADCIGVYHDARIMSTFKETIAKLQDGARIVIFPEHDVPRNNIVCDFQDRFIDVARMYYKKTGTALSFVPLYVAPRLKTMYLGRPVRFDPSAPLDSERRRICDYLMDEITGIARALPEHTVVPYRNIPKRLYPKNTDQEVHTA